MQPAKSLSQTTYFLYLIFFASLICSFRAISSISILLMFATGIAKNKLEIKSFLHKNVKNPFFICCVLLFFIHVAALAYTSDLQKGWHYVQLASGLVFVPLAVCCTNYINANTRSKLLSHYCLVLFGACLYCLGSAIVHYLRSGDPSFFFYHALVAPFHQHAVYFSVLVFIALVFLAEAMLEDRFIFNKSFHTSLIIFLSIFLFLLSSKFVIIFFLLYLLYYFILFIKKRAGNRIWIRSLFSLLVVVSSLALIIQNPVSNRFHDIFNGDLAIVEQEKFNPGNYFNGVQFRLLQWKLTGEILTDNKRWWYGVSPADAQAFLDQKYISKKMYTGDPEKGTTGYLGYNTHNQFLETLLQCGITGLIALLAVCASLVRIAVKKRKRLVSFVVLLLLTWLFSESVLETQFGIMIFTFFPLFLSFD
jgi:O-antigen ligase